MGLDLSYLYLTFFYFFNYYLYNVNSFYCLILNLIHMFEDAYDMAMLYSISPELTCTCDEFHVCQQCHVNYEEIL
jgi:hypothetical protein